MKTSFISNQAMQNAMRLTISRGQTEVQTLQKEIVTGRYADIGLALGAQTSNSITLNNDVTRLKSMQASNSLVTQRLSASQLSLNLMADSAQQMLEAFISVSGADDANRLGVAVRDVEAALGAFTVAANTSSNGEYLFAGINSSEKPLDDYFGAGSAAKAAFDTTFLAHFGYTQDDPQAVNITVTQMDDFITNVLEPAFSGPDWNTNWSSANDTNISSRILTNEVVDSGVNANADGMRKFALAAVIGLELLGSPISSEVRVAVNTRAMEYAGQAITGIDNQRGSLGLSENRVTKANDSLSSQIEILTLHVVDIEGVDAYEASTRMQALLTQVEMSYALTARIQQLNLMNYL
ncbi:flagellin/flagellar hook associated protein [Hoeflea sp. IMCC20628]|uniref:flagellar hook-associated family protein n=1 Tax=Hoeflea sp. IMCC20628 TaxID=1620421 RepID=UPI00063AD5A0|nr:flagellar hook-associated family protein [Hoeflea sp. IMCC20628]AKI02138.1 flagellin/flagellar hook associated protein [Hoeflea sp. IMCC20628]